MQGVCREYAGPSFRKCIGQPLPCMACESVPAFISFSCPVPQPSFTAGYCKRSTDEEATTLMINWSSAP